jgi:Spy/CpxP family protein refolding chaperone
VFSLIISLLPMCVTIILSIGQSLRSVSNPWIERLQLTPEQIEQIEAIENQYADRITQFEKELQQLEVVLTQLIVSTATADQLKQQERELETLKIEAAQVYFEKFLAIRTVLTSEQLLVQCEPYMLTTEQRIEQFRRDNDQ